MASRRSLFNSYGLVVDQLQAVDCYFSDGLAHQIIVLYMGWLMNRPLTGAPIKSLIAL